MYLLISCPDHLKWLITIYFSFKIFFIKINMSLGIYWVCKYLLRVFLCKWSLRISDIINKMTRLFLIQVSYTNLSFHYQTKTFLKKENVLTQIVLYYYNSYFKDKWTFVHKTSLWLKGNVILIIRANSLRKTALWPWKK